MENDELMIDFLIDDNEVEIEQELRTYKVLIADDEQDVHSVTKMVLGNHKFEGFRLELLHAYNESDTKKAMIENNDIAIILLDVVMDSDTSGLKIVEFIRNDLNNYETRIILRTGQPGIAPEEDVIRNFDINDYKTKTELTVNKLYTTIYSSIRSYRDIKTIEIQKEGLQKVVEASSNLYRYTSLEEFLNGILIQLSSLITHSENSFLLREVSKKGNDGLIISETDKEIVVIAGTGKFEEAIGKNLDYLKTLGFDIGEIDDFKEAGDRIEFKGNHFIAYHKGILSFKNYFYMEFSEEFADQDIIKLFITNSSLVLDNFLLNDKKSDEQKNLIVCLSELIEKRDKFVANHVKRVSKIVHFLSSALGHPEEIRKMMELASTLHDIGKIVVSDTILNKNGKLTDDEFNEIKLHTTYGYKLLDQMDSTLINYANNIAKSHHERWDGTGYPMGLVGEEIPIEARIVSIADVFDALVSRRPYKSPWSFDDAIDYLKNESGKHFDPNLVSIFVNNKAGILRIVNEYNDQYL